MKTFFRKTLIYAILSVIAVPASIYSGLKTVPKAMAAGTVPSLTIYTLDNPVISPNGDGVKDTATIDIAFSEQVNATIDILDSSDVKVKDLYSSSGGVLNPTPKVWDGKNNADTVVSNGTYKIKIDYTDTDGDNNNVVDTSKTITVDNQRLAVFISDNQSDTLVKAGDNVQITATFTGTTTISGTPTISLSPIGIINAPMAATADNKIWTYLWSVPAGNDGDVAVSISSTDSFGNANNPATGRTSYTIDNTKPNITVDTHTVILDQYAHYFDVVNASDNHDGDITDRIVKSGDIIDTANAGTFTTYYDVSDTAGNAALQNWKSVQVVAANPVSLTNSSKTATISVLDNNLYGTVVSIPDGISNSQLNLTALVSVNPNDVTVLIKHQVTVNLQTSSGVVQVIIPAGTSITGPAGWGGTLNLPEVVTNPASSTIAGRQLVITDLGTIALGLTDGSLTFDNPVEITFTGQAGKHVGFIDFTGKYTEITTNCNLVVNPTNIVGNGECKTNSGSDLIVWTKHFTQFATYNQTVTVPAITSATNVQKNGQNYIDLAWTSTGAGSYEVYVDGILVGSTLATSAEIQGASIGQHSVFVRAIVGVDHSDSNPVSVTVAIIAPSPAVTGTIWSSTPTTISTTATVKKKSSPLVSTAQAASPTVSAPVVPPSVSASKSDDKGIVKAAESTPTATETTNWTPWIVLFILIILAGAVTGGYFYWFAGKEELAGATNKDVRRVNSLSKNAKVATVTVRDKKNPGKKKANRW